MNRATKSWTTWTWTWMMALLVGFAVSGGQAAGAQSAQPLDAQSLLMSFWQKVGDAQAIDSALEMLTDDAVLRITPAPPGTPGVWTGKTELRQALQYASENAVGGVLQGSAQVSGNTATASVMMSNRFFLAWGVAPVKFSTELVVENGKIKSFSNTIAPEERERVAAAAQAAQAGQAPAGMPRTGGDQAGAPVALAIAGLACLLAAMAARRRYSRA